MAKCSEQYKSCTRLVIPGDWRKDKCSVALTSFLSKIDVDTRIFVSAKNLSGNQITLNNQSGIVHFEIVNDGQADDLIEIDPQLIPLEKMRNPFDFEAKLKQVIQDFPSKRHRPPDYSKPGIQLERRSMIFPAWRLCKEKFMIRFWNFNAKQKCILKVMTLSEWNL